MRIPCFALAALITVATAHDYDFIGAWPSLPEGQETIGESHGEIDVDSEGLIYVSVVGGKRHCIQICTVDFHGDQVAVAQLAGGVSILDKDGKLVTRLGANEDPSQTNTKKVPPSDWKKGMTTSPHGVTFDKSGNIVTTEWNQWGRLLRWEVKR